MDYDLLIKLISIPDDLDREKKKEKIPQAPHTLREEIGKRDHMVCQLCGKKEIGDAHHGNILHLHHIIPNGSATPDNLITLCRNCHRAVHLLLYTSKKWKYCSYNSYTYY